MTTPYPKIIDHYSLTVTPWVRLEFPDGRRESMAPAEALEHIRAARIVAAHQPRPGAAERIEARHMEREWRENAYIEWHNELEDAYYRRQEAHRAMYGEEVGL